MAFKPNYRQLRSERNRVKEQRKEEKMQRRQENAERRRSEREGSAVAGDPPETPDAPAGESE